MNKSEFNKIDDWFEEWEGDFELIQEENYEGLLKLRRTRAFDNPDNLYAQYYYGEALVLNKMYKDAIDYLRPIYLQNPDYDDIKYVLLDALYLSGRTENDFQWIKLPELKKIDKELINECYKILKSHGNTHINVVKASLSGKYLVYLGFLENELLESLRKDARFSVSKNNEISLTKK